MQYKYYMSEFIFFSEKDCKISINNCSVNVSKTMPKKIVISENKPFCFDYNFLEMEQGVFHQKIDFDGKNFVCDGNFLKLVKVKEDLFFVKILPKNSHILQKKVKKIVKNDIFFNFYQSGLVEIETKNELLFSDFINIKIVDADVLELKNSFYAVKFFGENGAEMSIVFSNFFEPLFMFESVVLESIENGFKVLTNLYDIAGHGIVEVFEIGEDVKKVDEYTVYMTGEPKANVNPKTLPMYFLECIKAMDYALAKKCLSNTLSQKSKLEHIKAYFGNFVDIDIFNDKIYLEYIDSDGSYFVKQYNFLIHNGKIEDIE